MPIAYRANDPMEAHWLVGVLETHGIAATVQGELLFGTRGETGLGPSSLPEIHVADEHVQRAAELIEEALRGRPTTAPAETEKWTCLGCKEEISAQFSACWSCGEARPAD